MTNKWIQMTDGNMIRWSDIRKVFDELGKSEHVYSYCETSWNEKLDFLDLTDQYVFCPRVGDQRSLYTSEVIALHGYIVRYIEKSDDGFFVLEDVFHKELDIMCSHM